MNTANAVRRSAGFLTATVVAAGIASGALGASAAHAATNEAPPTTAVSAPGAVSQQVAFLLSEGIVQICAQPDEYMLD